jgi:hypothetical protein
VIGAENLSRMKEQKNKRTNNMKFTIKFSPILALFAIWAFTVNHTETAYFLLGLAILSESSE